MRNTLKSLVFTLFLLSFSLASYSQTSEYPWALNSGMGMVRYQSHPGLPKLPGSTYAPALNLGVSRYLAGGFDFRTQLLLSHRVNFPTAETVLNSQLIDMTYQMVFKFNNGVLLRENSFIGPYISVGIGGSYMQNHPDVYVPLGGGIRFKFNDRLSARIETTKKISVNKDVQHIAHALAFVYNLNTKDIPIEKIEEEEMSEEMIVSALLPKDSDLDGIIDFDDQCPDDVGKVENNGCPEGISTQNLEEIVSSGEIMEIPEEEEELFVEEEIELFAEEETELFAEEEEELFSEIETALVEQEPHSEEELEEEPVLEYPEEETSTFSQLYSLNVLLQQSETATSPELAAVASPKEEEIESEEPTGEKIVTPCGNFSSDALHISPILFAEGSDELSTEARTTLDQLASMLQNCPSSQLVLNGHADAIGTENSNLVLSVMRAYNVKYYLVYEHGISQQRIRSKGLGEEQPLADNRKLDGRQLNRRVDFQLVF
ncbi:MAG: OmpA family protein [Bacteroidia bacterium]|nr:OmpA family protein [Bacteroidia bacterium]